MTLRPASVPLEPWYTYFQALRQKFHEKALDTCLLWIDPAQEDPFAGDLLVEKSRIRVPIAHPNFDLARAPYLVPLDISNPVDANLFERSVAIAWKAWALESLESFDGQPIAGWVLGSSEPKSLAQHWAENCHLHLVSRHKKLLRFHDPSVREWLWPELSLQQQRQLLGNAKYIISFDRQQELVVHTEFSDCDDIGDNREKTDGYDAPKLLLTADQWEEVTDYAVLHRSWLYCCLEDPKFRKLLAAKRNWQRGILGALRRATMYGIKDCEDRELFAIHALKFGESFHISEKMQAIFRRTRAGEFYGAACEEIAERQLDQFQLYIQDK